MSHVLVPIDWSELSRSALDHVAERFSDADVTVLYVIDPRTEYTRQRSFPGYTHENEFASEVQKAECVLERATERADERGLSIQTDTTSGEPSRSIIQYAEDHDVDHIVMGSHGRDRVARVLLGSVAETVVRRAPVPVTVIR